MFKKLLPALLLIVFATFSTRIWAQDVASITGTVTDPSGAVVPNVSVTLENPSTSVSYKAETNSVGSYTIQNVQPGPGYRITFAAAGFKPIVITGLYLNVSATRTQNAQLIVGGTTQSVEVSAASDTVTLNTTDATVGNNFQVQDLNELPVANRDSPAALFTQQPGVTLDGAVTGARVDQDNVTLDGLDVNDNETGNHFAIVGNAPVDSVQEFRGVTAGELSSAGEGGGGQYELVTRSGTNKFHGSLVEYHRDTDLEANDWFNNNNGVARPPLIRNQFGGNVGGPIKRDKGFFFFDWNSRRDTLSNLVERTVPMDSFRNGEVSYNNNAGGISTLSSSDVAALDPLGVGFSSSLQTVITSRYPAPNDLSGNVGDLVNTAGFRFNAPFPYIENDYVGRVDFNITSTQKLWGRGTVAREDATESAIEYPGDPQTHPFQDRSYGWVVGHNWTIGANKINQVSYGETYEDYSFPDTFNKTGVNQFSFGGIVSGGTFMSPPYSSATNAQSRTYPIPVARDDFSWQKGRHSFSFGGTFKWISPHNQTILDYNNPVVGIGGHLTNLNTGTGQPSLRPDDIATDSTSLSRYDSEFTFGLGRYQSVGATFNYNAQGNPVPQGTGSIEDYRFYETEVYFGDTWKLTPKLTFSYGLRWQNYTVPYERHGIESLPDLDFHQLFDARIAQSKAGAYGTSTDCNASGGGVPCVSYVLGGKANHAAGYFNPVYKNFAPRLAFAWSPYANGKTVLSGGGGIIYDHTVVSSIQYQAAQYSYLFQASANEPFGIAGDAIDSLKTDPRFAGFDNPPAPPAAPAAIKPPYTPFVDFSSGSPVPFGLANGQAFNEGVDRNLKTPYSIEYNLGMQHEFPGRLLLRTTYVGRLGRRLLGQVDANQLIDFPDAIGNSGQFMGQAFALMEQNLRAGGPVAPQPWFENMLPAGLGAALGFANNTDLVGNGLAPYPIRGDFADTVELLSAFGLIPDNVGMGSQFSEFTYYTNGGFSGYNGLLVTLHKNMSQGLSFDLNYTWAHSIDNVSVIANAPAIGGYGFICDALRPRLCRGNSDFDVANYLNGQFVWDLPIGRGKAIAGNSNILTNELIGGWSISGLPSWHTGNTYFANSNAFVAGYANSAPAILTGPIADMKIRKHKDADGTVWAFASDDAPATADYTGPVGFQIGGRNNLRGPQYFDLDLGLGKVFPIWQEKVNLKFRCDAFNALNHPSFDNPSNDITEASGVFGVISGTSSTARVLQLALRLEF
ncbi:MAG TPA: carboxypeptidase regulatory-like domain-containing protein [Terracidiphilus sp.]|nr:carboxypeptidase regulatory-like domain-containing protein [Terracidiphilus sp.]